MSNQAIDDLFAYLDISKVSKNIYVKLIPNEEHIQMQN